VVNGIENNFQTYQGQEHEEELGKNTYAFQWRDYDPAIARFNKIDRFAEKYASINPYHFTSNNPIRFNEIKGDSLWINYKGNSILYQNGNLLNKDGTTYTGKGVKIKKDGTTKLKGFLKDAVDALNTISNAEGQTGTDVVSTLQSSENNFYIDSASNNPNGAGRNEFIADERKKSYAIGMIAAGSGKYAEFGGSGGTVYWDPNGANLQELGGGTGNRPITNLAHEMFHAYDANSGFSDNRPVLNGLKRNEWRASYYENQIRRQLNYPYREFYRSGGTNYRLLDNQDKPINVSPPSIIWINGM